MSNQITPNPSVPSQVVAEVKFPRWINNLGIIPTSYKDSMSYYECLAWLCKFLEETVIPSVNENGEAVEELQNLYVELNSYVTHYFETLDVQEEINNKLDDMVEDGTLPEIIADYLNSKAVFGFDTVADMKSSTNLINGSYARTLGYYAKNDGGSSLYKIRTITNDDVIDEMSIISMNDVTNSLIAELIVENSNLNILQFGAKSNETQENFDNTTIIQNALNFANEKYDVIIPEGTFIITSTLNITSGSNTIIGSNRKSSIIKLKNTNPTVLLNLDQPSSSNLIKNITFLGDDNIEHSNKIHTCIRIAGNAQNQTYTGANWKNSFYDCVIRNFAYGVKFTSDRNVLDGAEVNFASENMFLHCKFKNNLTHVLQENMQGLNNLFEQSDLENESNNDDIDHPMIQNNAGGGMIFNSCSIMGGSILYNSNYPATGTTLWTDGSVSFNDCRLEIYSTNKGTLINQETSKTNAFQVNYININNMSIFLHNYSGDYNLINYFGRCKVNIDNLKISGFGGKLYVTNSIINGGSNAPFNELSRVNVQNCNIRLHYRNGSDTANNDERYISNIALRNNSNYQDQYDSVGFRTLDGFLDFNKYQQSFLNVTEKEVAVVYPNPNVSFANQKFVLPKGLFLTKLCLYKLATRYALNNSIKLYMVKDNADWADPTSFDKTTDAVLLAEIDTTYNSAGYFEVPIKFSSSNYNTSYGYDTRTGKLAGFTEGRYYLEDSLTNAITGFISLKYI